MVATMPAPSEANTKKHLGLRQRNVTRKYGNPIAWPYKAACVRSERAMSVDGKTGLSRNSVDKQHGRGARKAQTLPNRLSNEITIRINADYSPV